MLIVLSAASPDTGSLQPVVTAAGWIVSAAAAIGLGWRGRTRWEPVEESVGRGAAKVSGLLAAVGLALIWTQLGSRSHRGTLVWLTVLFALVCLASLLAYGFVVGTKVYDKEVMTGPGVSRTVRLVGGFRLTPAATTALERRPTLTVQELFKGAAYDPDKVWTRASREAAKQVLVLGYIGLTMGGTLALSCAAVLLVL